MSAITIIPVTDGDRSFVEWSAEFACEAGREDELRRLIGQEVFLAALKSLRSMMEGRRPETPPTR